MIKILEGLFQGAQNALQWIQALWTKHDDEVGKMVEAVLPIVIDVATRPDLSGSEKRDAVVDIVVGTATGGLGINGFATSLLNEAIEIAVNKYNIQTGEITKDNMDITLAAIIKAGAAYATNLLGVDGDGAADEASGN